MDTYIHCGVCWKPKTGSSTNTQTRKRESSIEKATRFCKTKLLG